ncbi:unnamed protein product, partial [Effrenium voratum]
MEADSRKKGPLLGGVRLHGLTDVQSFAPKVKPSSPLRAASLHGLEEVRSFKEAQKNRSQRSQPVATGAQDGQQAQAGTLQFQDLAGHGKETQATLEEGGQPRKTLEALQAHQRAELQRALQEQDKASRGQPAGVRTKDRAAVKQAKQFDHHSEPERAAQEMAQHTGEVEEDQTPHELSIQRALEEKDAEHRSKLQEKDGEHAKKLEEQEAQHRKALQHALEEQRAEHEAKVQEMDKRQQQQQQEQQREHQQQQEQQREQQEEQQDKGEEDQTSDK